MKTPGMAVAQFGDVAVRAWRGAGQQLDVQGHEHGLDAGGLQVGDDVLLAARHPGLGPVLLESGHIWAL